MSLRASRCGMTVALVVSIVGTVAIAAPAGAVRPGRDIGRSTPLLGHRVIGHSVEGRKIIAYHLGDPHAHRTAVILGQMHGDEPAGVTVAKSIIAGTRSVEGINLWVIPTMNPDGYAHDTRQNARHVDLNRNWRDKWTQLRGPYYSGPRPFSEPETRATARFFLRVRPQYAVILHQPLDGVDTVDGHGPRFRKFRNSLARNLHLQVKHFNCSSVCHGSLPGWYNKHHLGVVAETIEFGGNPGHAYLVGRARKGIVHALGGSFGSLRRHDPREQITVTRSRGQVRVTGWTYDPDATTSRLRIRLDDGDKRVGARRTRQPTPALRNNRGIRGNHGFGFTVAATPGGHLFCLTVHNVRVGADTRSCERVRVSS